MYIHWPLRPPEEIPGAQSPLRDFYYKNKYTLDDVMRAAEVLWPAGMSYGSLLMNLQHHFDILQTCLIVGNTIKTNRTDGLREQEVITVTTARCAAAIRPAEYDDGLLQGLMNDFAALNSEQGDYQLVFLERIQALCQDKKSADALARNSLVLFDQHELDALNDSLSGLDGFIRDGVSELKRLKKYGVKPCIFRTGNFLNSDESWVFQPVNSGGDSEALRVHRQSGDLARATIALTSSIESLSVKDEVRTSPRGIRVTESRPDYHPTFGCVLDPDGELTSFGSFGQNPYRKVFAWYGAEPVYDILRLTLLVQLFDLVVPLEVVKDAPSSVLLTGHQSTDESPSKSILDLLLPRLRMLEAHPDVRRSLEREVDRAVSETTQRRAIREHSVVGHVRRLSAGRKCSPEAAKIAWEQAGIRLADGETWVSGHIRGSGNPVRGHRARKRKKSSNKRKKAKR